MSLDALDMGSLWHFISPHSKLLSCAGPNSSVGDEKKCERMRQGSLWFFFGIEAFRNHRSPFGKIDGPYINGASLERISFDG